MEGGAAEGQGGSPVEQSSVSYVGLAERSSGVLRGAAACPQTWGKGQAAPASFSPPMGMRGKAGERSLLGAVQFGVENKPVFLVLLVNCG